MPLVDRTDAKKAVAWDRPCSSVTSSEGFFFSSSIRDAVAPKGERFRTRAVNLRQLRLSICSIRLMP